MLSFTIRNVSISPYPVGTSRVEFDLDIHGATPSTVRVNDAPKFPDGTRIPGGPWIAKTLRDILMTEIPTVAIELVWIEQNDSALDDEILAHRLGMIPLYYENIDEIFAGGPAEFELSLDVKCSMEAPKGATCSVRANNLVANIEGLRPAMDLEIIKLLRGQTIRLRAQTKRGTSLEHAKFSPVSIVAFRPVGNAGEKDVLYHFTYETVGAISPEKILQVATTILGTKYPGATLRTA